MPALDRHDAEWRSASYQQIMRDDAAEDAIYDSLSRLKAPGTEARGTDTGPLVRRRCTIMWGTFWGAQGTGTL